MLKNIPKIISPELIKVLMEMGHGDEIVLADGNYPAASNAQRLVRYDGHGVPEILDAILTLIPLDTFVEYPIALMNPGNDIKPEIWEKYKAVLHKHEPDSKIEYMERFSFYDRAKKAYAIIATGETALYANVILKKGVISE